MVVAELRDVYAADVAGPTKALEYRPNQRVIVSGLSLN